MNSSKSKSTTSTTDLEPLLKKRKRGRPRKAKEDSAIAADRTPAKIPYRRTAEQKQAIIDEVLERISNGESIHEIAKSPNMPSAELLNRWIINDTHGAGSRYMHAREARADRIAREIFEIADNAPTRDPAAVNKARLQVDARKWYLSKILPEKYGDHIELTGRNGGPLSIAAIGAVGIADIQAMRNLIFGDIAADGEDHSSLTDSADVEATDNA